MKSENSCILWVMLIFIRIISNRLKNNSKGLRRKHRRYGSTLKRSIWKTLTLLTSKSSTMIRHRQSRHRLPFDRGTEMLAYIWAEDSAHHIGINGRLPWHLPNDLAYFKRQTSGHPMIMGKKRLTVFRSCFLVVCTSF